MVDLVREVRAGTTSRESAIRAVDGRLVSQASLRLEVEPSSEGVLRGVGAGQGAASGHAVFKTSDGALLAAVDVPFVLVVYETFPEDIEVMRLSRGVVTVSGGITGHAGVVSRGLGKPCIGSGSELDLRGESLVEQRGPKPRSWSFGDRLSFDGRSGAIVDGSARLARLEPDLEELLGWADAISGAKILASVSTEVDAADARAFGASSIVVGAPDALLLGKAKKPLVGAVLRGEPNAVEALRDALRFDITRMGEAFGKPIEHIRPLGLAAFADPRLQQALTEASAAAGVVSTDVPAQVVGPDGVARARLEAALAVLGPEAA